MASFPDQSGPGLPSGLPGNPSPFGTSMRPRSGVRSFIARLGLSLFIGLILTVIVGAVWPGAMKLFAPVLCGDATPDPFVVVDQYQVRPGETAFTYTLYCVGPTGSVDEIGWLVPFALLGVILTVIAFALLVVIGARIRAGRDRLGWSAG